MQTRRDLVQAYEFATGRLASALVSGNPGSGEIPMRRSGLGAMFGVLVALLLVAGFTVFGLLVPGDNSSWRQPGSLIVEEETGNRYIYAGGVLHPVANYASALLLLNGKEVLRKISRDSLVGVPHGTGIGIPGAPDSIPTARQLLPGAWTYCLHPDRPGDSVVDFSPRANTTLVPDRRWVLLSGPGGSVSLLWDGQKYPLVSRADIVALGMDSVTPVAASSTWLNAVPTGPAITAPQIPNLGGPGPEVAGQPTRVGGLFHSVIDGQNHYYVALSDGLAPISHTESALLSARTSRPSRPVSRSEVAVAAMSPNQSLLSSIPDVLGDTTLHTGGAQLDTSGQALCVLESMDGRTVQTSLVQESGPASAAGSRVLVPPGSGLLVSPPPPSPDVTPQSYLITDLGEKFLLGDSNAAQDLGYSGVATLVLPQAVFDQIPTGPVLSAAGAARPDVPVNGVGP